MIKIPGTAEGLPAIEESIFAGIPVNVTLLFSREHYLAAAEAFLRGIERRIEAGLRPDVASVASVFVSRWDSAVADDVPDALRNQLGIAIAKRTYKAYRSLLSSPRWQRIYNAGAPAAAAAVGQHRHQGPEGVRRHVRQGAGRTIHGQHHARGDVERARRSRRAHRDSCRPTAATARRCWRGSPRRGGSCRRSRPGCRKTAPRRSSSRGIR